MGKENMNVKQVVTKAASLRIERMDSGQSFSLMGAYILETGKMGCLMGKEN